jgi:hypothetical protein
MGIRKEETGEMETTKKQKGEEESNAEPCDAPTTLGVDGR